MSHYAKIEELTPEYVGKKIKCYIDGTKICEGKIQLSENCYFICQNERNGNPTPNRLGYRFSWCVDSGSQNALLNNRVGELYLVDNMWDSEENEG